MSEKSPNPEHEYEILIQHSQWIAERAEKSVEGILSRSGVLLGAIGVELTLIPSGILTKIENPYLRLAPAFLLVAAGFCLILALWPRKRLVPGLIDLHDIYRKKRKASVTAITHLINIDSPNESFIRQLTLEAKHRGCWLQSALVTFGFAQIPLAWIIGVSQ